MLRSVGPWCLAVLDGIALCMPLAHARGADTEAHNVASVFFVAKSENRNQVHYGIHLDDACAPLGEAPVYAYWRMLERGPLATEPLPARERPAYGIAAQSSVPHDERQGGRIVVTLNALPDRLIAIDTTSTGAMCVASAMASIGGVPALLTSVFVQLRWPFGVDHVMLSGRAPDGLVLRERLAR